MFWDVLGTEKQLAQLCNRAALEAGQPGLYQDLMAILNETQACHRELFHVMLQRGWYHLHPADLMQTQQVFHDFHSMAQSLNNQNQGNQGEPGQSTQSGGNGAASGGSASGGSGNTSGGSSSGGSGGN
ncbi:hypothetical protein GTO89_03800 [Heliobacterium gestii]|uniref:Spore coat protein n=2 Tax=Heliomicrobium gestii TaxID=2699 RepID=A0A845L999_HELGE|nr:hypothetical protein [Heliomicrobium gestii]